MDNKELAERTKVVQPYQIAEKKNEIALLLNQLEERRKSYGILDAKMDRIPGQTQLFNDIIDRLNLPLAERFRFYLYYGGNGAGKCWGYGETMMMADGTFKEVQDISVGDKLMGIDSLPREVLETHQGVDTMYRITPESGEPIVVNGGHQLMLVHRRRNRKGERNQLQQEYSHLSNVVPEGKLIQISVDDYLKKSNKWKAEAYMWRPRIINFPTKEQKIDPYFLGLWLGDGTSITPSITNIDPEVTEYIKEYAESIGLEVEQRGITYFLKKKYKSRYGFSGYSLLREYDLLGNKHIPLDYKTGDENQRLKLLAGIIDTDGEVSSDGRTPRYSITQKSEILARDIMYVARSLGFRSNIVKTTKTCTNHTKEDYSPGTYYRVIINGDVGRIPVRIARKIMLLGHIRMNNKDFLVSKFIVENIGIDAYYGFGLSGDSLHLDKNFIVQHNSFVGAYLTVLMALGYEGKKYNLPFIGVKKNIWIATKSGSNVKSTIAPYLLGDYSKTRIPPDEIEKITQDNGILKAIRLKNGCEIHIKTYDQGQENVQGGNPDWMWLDEEPTNPDVWSELKARTRKLECEMVITMTPLNGLTGVYDFFFNADNPELSKRCKIYRVSSLDNPFTDKTWTMGMTEEEYRLRVDGSFENPTGLVYSSFMRTFNVVPHFDPKLMGEEVRYYRAIDFGTSHPTAIVFVAQDRDDNLYVYDEIRLANTELKEIARAIGEKSRGKEFMWFVRDSAAKREGLELEKQYGIYTIPADKYSKGANDMSNRRTGILLLNTLFKSGKLMISDNCPMLIKELETHYYKENGKRDGEVIKENDDLIDALRYCIFLIKNNNSRKGGELIKNFNRKNMKNNSSQFMVLGKSPVLSFK